MKSNAHIGTIFKTMVLACLVLGYASCVEDEEITSLKDMMKSNVVTFGIDVSNKWKPDVIGEGKDANSRTTSTDSYGKIQSSRSEGVLMNCKGVNKLEEDIYIHVIEEDCPVPKNKQTAISRGANNEENASYGVIAYKGTGNVPEIYLGTNVVEFMNKVGVNNDGEVIGNQYYWPGGGTWLKFFAYSPANLDIKTSDETQLYFPTFTYEVPENVLSQDDIMMGESVLRSGSETSQVGIELTHLLSKIQVKKGNLGSNAVIKSIAFSGIKNSGTYKYVKKSDSNDYIGTWAINNIAKKFKQPYIEENSSANTPVESDDSGIDSASEDKPELIIDETTNVVGKPFYLLPQDLENAIIEVDLEVTSTNENGESRINEYHLEKSLNDITAKWESDKQYTYVITTPQEVEVEVSDNVVFENGYPVKKDFTITNTGLSSVFVRVAMVGSWVIDDDANGQLIVEDWKDSDGEFDWGEGGAPEEGKTNSRGWRKDENGIYYYMKPLNRGETAEPLFNTYTLTANVPMVGAYLNLTMAVQTVIHEDISIAWPEITSIVEPIK